MRNELPKITGTELIALLKKDGWQLERFATHGAVLSKFDAGDGRMRVTVVQHKNKPTPSGTLSHILGHTQTNIGRKGLLALLEKYS
jgi:predicted RNA binding protein YcfA (HicA-like mRNA interferase family)